MPGRSHALKVRASRAIKKLHAWVSARGLLGRALAIFFWLGLWQFASARLDQELLLVSPLRALATLLRLMGEASFYRAVGHSFGRILLGFGLATALGILLAALAARFAAAKLLTDPLMHAVKATPVASFVILALIWLSSRHLTALTSFLMVLPVMYTNVLAGIRSADKKLLEMALVFRVPLHRRLTAIYLPAASDGFLAACALGMGLCWKAGIAAEVIALPEWSIGSALYQAKIFLSTPELFAWTLAIIFLSVAFTRLILALFRLLIGWLEGGEFIERERVERGRPDPGGA